MVHGSLGFPPTPPTPPGPQAIRDLKIPAPMHPGTPDRSSSDLRSPLCTTPALRAFGAALRRRRPPRSLSCPHGPRGSRGLEGPSESWKSREKGEVSESEGQMIGASS